MIPKKRAYAAALAIVLSISVFGCASVNPDPAFRDVQKTIAERTGQNLSWIRDEAANAQVEEAIKGIVENDLTLDAAVQIALLNNRSIQATYEDIGISQADLVQAGLLRNPQIAVSARFPESSSSIGTPTRRESTSNLIEHVPKGIRPNATSEEAQSTILENRQNALKGLATGLLEHKGEATTTNIAFSVAEDFLDLVLLPMRKKVAAQQLEQTKLRVSAQALELISQVKQAFYTVQAREQLLDRLRVILEADEAAAEFAGKQHEAGTINTLDLTNQRLLYGQTRIELAQAHAQERRDRESLNRLLGLRGANTEWKIESHLPDVPNETFSTTETETLAMSQRLDLAAINAQVAVATKSLSLEKKTRLLPAHINLGLDAEREADRLWVRGPSLELEAPIFDQGQAKVGRLQAQLRQVLRTKEAFENQIRIEVREATTVLDASRTAALAYRDDLLPGRALVLELTLQHYNFMLKGAYDLLLARQQQAQTEQAYIEAARDYWIARSELERAVGGKLAVEPKAAEIPPPVVNTSDMPEEQSGEAPKEPAHESAEPMQHEHDH